MALILHFLYLYLSLCNFILLSEPPLDWSESGLCINTQFENILLLKVEFYSNYFLNVCTVAPVYPKLSVPLTGLFNGDY